MTKIRTPEDWLAFLDEQIKPAERLLADRGIPEDQWLALAGISGRGATHIQHMAGTEDPTLIDSALAVIRLREVSRDAVGRLNAGDTDAAGLLAGCAWQLHQALSPFHAEPIEKALKHRPARQAARRIGKYGLNRLVLMVAYDQGYTTPRKAEEWLHHNPEVDLPDGENVTVRWNESDRCFDLTPLRGKGTFLNRDTIKATLANIRKDAEKKP